LKQAQSQFVMITQFHFHLKLMEKRSNLTEVIS